MSTLEREVEAALRHAVEARGGRCLKWVCPGWTGVPDRICLLPGGQIFFAETKRPKGGRLAPVQTWWHAQLRLLGFRVVVIKEKHEIMEVLNEYR